jgi:hypothetical protein
MPAQHIGFITGNQALKNSVKGESISNVLITYELFIYCTLDRKNTMGHSFSALEQNSGSNYCSPWSPASVPPFDG